MEQKPLRIDMGGLWRNKTAKGNEYISGPFGKSAFIQIWPNRKRDGKDTDPDFTMCIVPRIKKDKEEFDLSKVEVNVMTDDSQDPGPQDPPSYTEIPF